MDKRKGWVVLALVALIGIGCALSKEDYVVTAGREGAWPAGYVTFRLNSSAQLLLMHALGCKGDGACSLKLMKDRKPDFCALDVPGFGCLGQAEYDEVFNPKYGAEFTNAVNQVASVNEPRMCVRVAVWKYRSWLTWETGVRWYAIRNQDCQPGGDLLH